MEILNMIEPTFNPKITPYMDDVESIVILDSAESINKKKLWLEFQKIKLKYGDPHNGESVVSALGMRSPDWKRTVVNNLICMVDNPFYEPKKMNDRFNEPSTVSKLTEDPLLVLQKPQIELRSDIIVKEVLVNNNFTENKENEEIIIDDQETEVDEMDGKRSPRITMRRIFLISFFTLLDLLDPYIAIILMS